MSDDAVLDAQGQDASLAMEPAGSCVVIVDGVISHVGEEPSSLPTGVTRIDAQGGAILPGLIDAHTHLVFAGDRIDEFAAKSRGATYEHIAKSGGGIWKTVQATREASGPTLMELARPRLAEMVKRGVTTVEGKSGYGLTERDERKILQVYRDLSDESGIDIVNTFLAAHTVPRDYEQGTDRYVEDSLQWLRRAHQDGLVDGVDMFVERTAFAPQHARGLAEVAKELSLPLRLHVDQLHDGNGASLAAELGALSADHLEHTNDGSAAALATAGVVATLVPFATLLVGRGQVPPVAALREAGVRFVVATDFNPGSAPALDLHMAGFLALAHLRLTIDEVLFGMTKFAARALGIEKTHGTLEVDKVGDVVILNHPTPSALFYELGRPRVQHVVKRGRHLIGA